MSKDRAFKSVSTRFDEEHNLWEVSYVSSQGAEYFIRWELSLQRRVPPDDHQVRQIEANLEPPFVVEHVKRSSAKAEEAEDEAADSESAAEMTVEEKADKKAKAVKRRPTASRREEYAS